MKLFRFLLPLVGVLFALSWPAAGQQTASNKLVDSAVETALKQYNASFVGPPQLFNGPEYIDYSKRYHASIGYQFFLAPEKLTGGVYYHDHYFASQQLAYDVVLDQLVLKQPTSPLSLRLINEQVRYFNIDGHHFVRLLADSCAGGVIQTGFYEVLAGGRVEVVAKRAKKMQEVIDAPVINVQFLLMDRLYIKKAGTYYSVPRKGAVIRLFADHSKEVQAFIKAQKLVLKKAQFESSVVKLAQYYSSLPTQ